MILIQNQIEKTMDTLIYQTLKVEGNKVPLVFEIFAQDLQIYAFPLLLSTTSTRCHHQILKRAISQHMSQN